MFASLFRRLLPYRAATSNIDFALVGVEGGLHALQTGDPDAAIRCFEEHLTRNPDDAKTYNNLGVAFQQLGRHANALECYETAARLEPGNSDAWYNAALMHHLQSDWARAEHSYLRAIHLDPTNAEAHREYSMLRLVQGDFSSGIWASFRHRRSCNGFEPTSSQCPAQVWNGESLAGKNVLAYGEQGIGDEILFASCYRDLMARASHCVIETEPRLESLFRRSFPGATVFSREEKGALEALYPSISYKVPCGDLPFYFRSSADAFPDKQAYLSADADAVVRWKRLLDSLGDGLKVGVSWRGGTARTGQARRSIELDEWRPLFAIPNIHLISLQYGECSDELSIARDAFGVNLRHWPDAISDYDETAALISALDLAISVQTSVVHLAGALGQDVWILANAAPRWCYMAKGEGMPWYPSARIFRQHQPGDWSGVMEQVENALRLR